MSRRTGPLGLVVFVALLMVVSTFGIAASGAARSTPVSAPTTSVSAIANPASTTLASETLTSSTLSSPTSDTTAPPPTPVNTCSDGSAPSSSSPLLAANGDQIVNGELVPGGHTPGTACVGNNTDPAPAPSGINYIGENNTNGVTGHNTIDSNSIAAIQTVYSTSSLFPDSLTPNRWGDQLNVILANVTVLGHRGYFYWIQSLAEYDTSNDTLSFYDATWNFTSGTSGKMLQSTLASWSPYSSDYINIWLLAITPYIYCPPPFTLTLYVNSTVTAAGNQELWYNYSVLTNGHFYADGSYDWLVFQSQVPGGSYIPLTPAPFEASWTTRHGVNEGYEFDTMIGPDTSSNEINFIANETIQEKYCTLAVCTNTNFRYANVPAANNYGSQTAEGSIGLSINFVGATAYATAGPFIEHGLWNYTGSVGVVSGYTKVVNAISVSGSPLALSAQPYVFVFFESTNFTSQGFQWAPDVPAWYLMPGRYSYELMLADYKEQFGNITVGASTVTLTAVLPYSFASGVYTPLWAFNNAQVAGISSSGAGTISNQYILFNNPTTVGCTFCGGVIYANNLSSIFYLAKNSYTSYAGIILSGTNVYIDVNAPPSFCVRATATACSDYLSLWFDFTSHVTLSHATAIRGWPSPEWDFYIDIPGSQNMFPQGDVDVLSSTNDLIMGNTFVQVSGSASPASLVLHGGSNNVVWGNTFRNPPTAALGATYAGIGEDEGGDLIYNNNFTIDNPVVLTPYNMSNDAECLPQCSGTPGSSFFFNTGLNTWNITPQPASNVKMVNGFALSGNVLGPSYTTQGGNFYWNYGRAPNNATGTYVSRFLYTDLSQIYPLGCPNYQVVGTPCGTPPPVVGGYMNGMPSGSADFAPLTIPPIPVTFTETGLPSGTSWAVVFNGAVLGSTTSSITFGNQAQGLYPYQIATVPGYTATVASGSISITGQQRSITQAVTFARTGYTVTFTEVGLASGTTWTATLNGTAKTSATSGTTISFTGQLPGTLAFSLTGKAGYLISPMSGTVTVVSSAINIPVTFSKTMYAVTFTETGYSGAWAVALGNVVQSAAAGGPIVFNEPNGSYAYKVAMVSGYTAAPSSGTATVAGAAVPEAITYSVAAPPTYSLQFTENGLPSGTMWSVTVTGVGGGTLSSTSNTITFSGLLAGTYPYSFGAVVGYTTPSGGSAVISTASVSLGVVYSAPTYAVTFTESGLPAGTLWAAAFGGQIGTSIGTTIVF
ncbi:MAG: thermopsin family protease, partial [Thermoplasmata archaeon]